MAQKQPTTNPWLATRSRTGAEYDAPYQLRAQEGIDIHGEANVVEKLLLARFPAAKPSSLAVLDAGCGTGRTAIELARRGFDVVGLDLDMVMLGQAQKKAPQMNWILGDLATTAVSKQFDLILLAGNVMIYLTPGSETAVLHNLIAHLKPNGLLLTAFELTPQPWRPLTRAGYEQLAQQGGLTQLNRWCSWDLEPWRDDSAYLVSLHSR